ncbi:sigma-70 family RNA polymerase sigma factor, partial [Flavonifractor plautii]|uniref:RNA polymerase sigma factor n=1 Tax=Flavonifractor plautii TaxID=292800 RepID=UPI00210A395F
KLFHASGTGGRHGADPVLVDAPFNRFTPYVSAVVVRVLAGQGAREDVEELTAEVFLALWAHAGELNPEQGLRPWLGTVARNRAADWLRTHKEAAPLPEDAATPGGADPQAEAERREWAARLWDAVEGLDEP